MTSKNAIVDICKYIVDIHNDIFTSHNVFLDIQNDTLDIWNWKPNTHERQKWRHLS